MKFRYTKDAASHLRDSMTAFYVTTKDVAIKLLIIYNEADYWNDKKKAAYIRSIQSTGLAILDAARDQEQITADFSNKIEVMKE